jgi:ATP/maltotriose-dependent transcriptional regulator MalT
VTAGNPLVERARAALARHDWPAVYAMLTAAEGPERDDTAALETLADAAWWLSKLDECIATRERAYSRFDAEGDARGAARTAIHLYSDHTFKGRSAVAGGWLQRARRLLDGLPECVEQGLLLINEAEVANSAGELELALEKAERAVEIGRRLHDRDLEADGLQCSGRLLIALGRPADGLALFDEAMLSAVEGRLGPFATGKVYCSLISACDELGDFQRAAEWTEVGGQWAENHPFAVFPGLCRVHRAEVLSLKGDWAEAEEEARRAYTELCDVNVFNAGSAFYEIGEIRRRLGDFDAAEEAYRRADELGRSPQPGCAFLRLAQGRVEAATSSISTALAGVTWDRLARAKLLPAQVEIAAAAGDLAAAGAAATELDEIAEEYATPWLRAVADLARGRLDLITGKPEAASGALRRALHHWQTLDIPYEVASTRVLLGSACRSVGDEEAAAGSFDAAAAIFERLGADADADRARELREGKTQFPDGLTAREAEVLCLVSSGQTNKQVAGELFLSDKTVARHLSNIFCKIGVSTRAGATAYAFEHNLVSRG